MQRSWADFARQQAKRRIEAEAALAKAVDGLKKLAEPPPDNPVGDPWNFYQDTVDYAAQVLVEIEAIRAGAEAVEIDAVARNEALKSYKHSIDNGYPPRAAMDGAIRDYLRRAALASSTKIGEMK